MFSNLKAKKFRGLHFLLGAAALFIPISKFCKEQTQGFSVPNISYIPDLSKVGLEGACVVPENPEELQAALSQEYRFLDRGGQAFAFISQDEKYVLKFFRKESYSLPMWIHIAPLKVQKKRRDRLLKKIKRDYGSYQIASSELKEECSLVASHLGSAACPFQKISLIDRIGIRHGVDLSKVYFILQKKATPLHSFFDSLIQQKDLMSAKRAIDAIFDLMVRRCNKGIFDEDPKIHKNLGFEGEKILFIDTGRFVFSEDRKKPSVQYYDLLELTRKFDKWLKQQNPELSLYLLQKLQEYEPAP